MGVYDDAAQSANEALLELGVAATITKYAQGEYNRDTGGYTSTPTEYPVQAVVFPYSDRLIDGTTVLRGDERAYIAPAGAPDIKATDTLTIGGRVWTVINAKTLAPAGTVVLIELQVRA